DVGLLLGVIGLFVHASHAGVVVLFQLAQRGVVVALQAVLHGVVGIVQGCHAAVVRGLGGGAALGFQRGRGRLLLGVEALQKVHLRLDITVSVSVLRRGRRIGWRLLG